MMAPGRVAAPPITTIVRARSDLSGVNTESETLPSW